MLALSFHYLKSIIKLTTKFFSKLYPKVSTMQCSHLPSTLRSSLLSICQTVCHTKSQGQKKCVNIPHKSQQDFNLSHEYSQKHIFVLHLF